MFFADKPMTLARWPNDGFVKIVGLVEPDTVNVRGTKGSRTGKFMYAGNRPKRWIGEKDAWVHGYWFWDWSDERQKLESLDAERRIISLAPPYHSYGGIVLDGGDRKSLTPAGHRADNNRIHHYSRWNRTYQPAIALHGVGNGATHNLIHDAPHMAIYFSGNDHIIEFNEIHDVCRESNDAGAVYAGRDWTMRGTVIRHNYLHFVLRDDSPAYAMGFKPIPVEKIGRHNDE